jgi:hypothetical protein
LDTGSTTTYYRKYKKTDNNPNIQKNKIISLFAKKFKDFKLRSTTIRHKKYTNLI